MLSLMLIWCCFWVEVGSSLIGFVYKWWWRVCLGYQKDVPLLLEFLMFFRDF